MVFFSVRWLSISIVALLMLDATAVTAASKKPLGDTTQLIVAAATTQSTKQLPQELANSKTNLPNQLFEKEAILLGDKDISLQYLQAYYDYYADDLKPELVKLFPELAQVKENPIFVVTNTIESAKNWTDWTSAWGVFNGQYLLLMEHHRNINNGINRIILSHEFIHFIVDKVYGANRFPTFINEGMAHNVTWMLYENRTDWNSSIVTRDWEKIATTNDSVPDLWQHRDQDKWTITSVAYLVQQYGIDKLIKYLKLYSNDKNAFIKAFGVTENEFQNDYRKKVKELRDSNGIETTQANYYFPPPISSTNPESPPRTYDMHDVGLRLNGKYIELYPSARVVNGVTYVPLRGVFDEMGAKVDWKHSEEKSKTDYSGIATITLENIDVKLLVGTNKVIVNGNQFTLDIQPFINDEGFTFVPLRFISESIGAKVNWKSDIYAAIIDTK